MSYILFNLNEKLYIKDPQKSEIGKAIISHSIRLVYDVGFEHLTFRKIAEEMESTEATVYRYFENKFRLLQYLVDWYWASMGFEMVFT
jgi:AcrR family transcriptional regulator